MSSNDVTITEALAIALADSNDRAFYEYPYSEHDRAEYRAKARALMPALRAHFAAERMPEDVQKLVAEAREVIDRGVAPGDRAPLRAVLDALEAVYSQKVEPEPEYKMPGYDEVLEKLDALTIRKDN